MHSLVWASFAPHDVSEIWGILAIVFEGRLTLGKVREFNKVAKKLCRENLESNITLDE